MLIFLSPSFFLSAASEEDRKQYSHAAARPSAACACTGALAPCKGRGPRLPPSRLRNLHAVRSKARCHAKFRAAPVERGKSRLGKRGLLMAKCANNKSRLRLILTSGCSVKFESLMATLRWKCSVVGELRESIFKQWGAWKREAQKMWGTLYMQHLQQHRRRPIECTV